MIHNACTKWNKFNVFPIKKRPHNDYKLPSTSTYTISINKTKAKITTILKAEIYKQLNINPDIIKCL